MQSLVRPLIDHFTYEESETDDLLMVLNRQLVIEWACEMRLDECSEETYDQFQEFLNGNENEISKNLRSTIFCNGLKSSKDSEFKDLLRRLETLTHLDERFSIIDGLGCFHDDNRIREFLMLSDTISATEQLRIIMAVLNGRMNGFKIVLDFLIESHESIVRMNWPTIIFELSIRITDDINFEKVKTSC